MAVKCILTGQIPSVLDGVTENVQTQIDGKQAKITASGLLKGDGAGGVTTAIKGTDYVASPEVFIATYGTTTSAEIEAAYQAGKPIIAIYPGKAVQYHIFQRSSSTNHKFSTFALNGKVFTIQCVNDVWSDGQNNSVRPSAHAATHASGGIDPITPADIGAQPSITASGILKGDGAGGVSAAVKGTDYAGISETVTATLLAASWTGTSAPYSYTLTVSGVTATSNQEVLPALNITVEQLEALQSANIQDGGQAANSVTLTAFGDKPTIDLPIRVIVRGDS